MINALPFEDYLNGIAETSEAEHSEKLKVMSLLVKSYAIFYLNGKNKHPSIPQGANYQAIDHPDFFQKYVGAGAEKVFKRRKKALQTTKNQILIYSGYVPILPYFSCSVGFTRTAKEKRGRKDTPYLLSRIDPATCTSFAGHGVGLSGKGAQFFAQQGRTMEQILSYYYPGVEIVGP
jgi:SpoIID/LytB domain protein